MATEKLYDKWAARNPQWETKYEDLIKTYCDYGKGETSLRKDRAKLFGAGYELYIVAFFIGLYANQRRPLVEDTTKRKEFGWAIENWGNIEKRLGRTPYPKIRDYIFAALIARSDIDFIALDKGDLSLRKAVNTLIQTMEETPDTVITLNNGKKLLVEEPMEDVVRRVMMYKRALLK